MRIIYLFVIMAFFQNIFAEEWHGIKPLYSTRENVEEILGKPDKEDYRDFALENESVFINYSDGICSKSYRDYKVSKDTVLSIMVYSKWTPFSKLSVDKSKYKKIETFQPDDFWYKNDEDGIRYVVRGDMVVSVEYSPTAKDTNLLCPEINNSNDNQVNKLMQQNGSIKMTERNLNIFKRTNLFSFAMAYGQNQDYYTITGRIIDENGKPNSDAGVIVEPAKYNSKQFDRFIEGIGTDVEGRFTKKIVKNKFTSGETYFLFVTLDTNLDALQVIDPPFDRIRKYDKAFNGKFIKFGNEKLIDVGDVKIQFWYGQANLNFADYFKKKNIDPIKIGWRGLYIQVRNARGYRVYTSTLSISDIQKYVDQANSKIRISLPEGKWKVEILEDYLSPKIGESAFFEIKKAETAKEIAIISLM